MSVLLVVRHAAEGPGLLSWGLRAASALELPLEVIFCDAEASEELVWRQEGDEPPVFLRDSKVRWGRVQVETALRTVVDHVMAAGVKYVFTGKRNSGQEGKGSPERHLSRALFEQVPCAVMVMRLPEGGESKGGRILVPAAGEIGRAHV